MLGNFHGLQAQVRSRRSDNSSSKFQVPSLELTINGFYDFYDFTT